MKNDVNVVGVASSEGFIVIDSASVNLI